MIIINASIKREELDQLRPDQLINGKTAVFIPLSIFVGDENDRYGNNVSIQISQSQEDRLAKKSKTYVGNGKVVFVKGAVKTAKEIEAEAGGGGGNQEPF